MPVIVVAGSSAIKFHANNEAQMAVGLDADVESCEGIESGVNPQPFGMKEISQGARNRSAAAVIARPGADIYVGIENGLEIIGPDEETVDLAVISIVCPKEGFEIIGCTEGVLVPHSIVLETMARGFDRVTMGEVLAATAAS